MNQPSSKYEGVRLGITVILHLLSSNHNSETSIAYIREGRRDKWIHRTRTAANSSQKDVRTSWRRCQILLELPGWALGHSLQFSSFPCSTSMHQQDDPFNSIFEIGLMPMSEFSPIGVKTVRACRGIQLSAHTMPNGLWQA